MDNWVLGNKNVLALEFQVSSPSIMSFSITSPSSNDLAHLRLWIGGYYLGSIEDSQMIDTAIFNLDGLSKNTKNEIDLVDKNKSAEQLIEKFNSQEPFLLSLGECFDDFHLCAARYKGAAKHEDEILFVWQLHDEPYFNYENYPKRAFKVTIKVKDYERFMVLIKSSIAQLKQNSFNRLQ